MSNVIYLRNKMKQEYPLSERHPQKADIVRGLRNTAKELDNTYFSMKKLTNNLKSAIKICSDAEQALRQGNERRRRMMETIESIEAHGLQGTAGSDIKRL